MSLGGWRYVAASVIGTSHEKTSGPCQDSNECRIFSLPTGESVCVAAAADGAGTAMYSGVGAAKTCAALLELVDRHFRLGNSVEQITRETVASWIAEIQRRLDDEGASLSCDRRLLACTLLAFVIGESRAVCFQIGDGVIVLADSEERAYGHVFWPDRGEYANTTHFVTEEDALDHLQFDSISRCIVDAALLTDGLQTVALNYQQQAAYAPFFTGLFAPLRTVPEGRSQELSESLAAFLSSQRVNEKTDDDKTLVLATRADSTPAATNG